MSKLEKYREYHMRFAGIYLIFCMAVILAHPIIKDQVIKNPHPQKILYVPIAVESENLTRA